MATEYNEPAIPEITIVPASPLITTAFKTNYRKSNDAFLAPPRENSRPARRRSERKRAAARQQREAALQNKISDLENEVIEFITWVFGKISEGTFRDLDQIRQDIDWALSYLLETTPRSVLFEQLQLAKAVLKEVTPPGAAGRRLSIDPIWTQDAQWTPNDFTDRKFFGVEGDDLDQMLQDGIFFNGTNDPYAPFALCEAQDKYITWSSGLEFPDPSDPDYTMLIYAHKASTSLLKRFKDTAEAMERFTDRYVEEIRRGDLDYLREARKLALEQFIPDAPSGIAGKRVFDTCLELRTLYDVVRPGMLPLRSRQKSAKLLERWKETLTEWKFGTQLTSAPSLQEANTFYATSLFWKRAFRCTERIEAAHNDACIGLSYAVSVKAFLEIEELLWRLWVGAICEDLCLVKAFSRKIHSSFLPSIDDFLCTSIAFWEAKVFQQIRRLRHFRSPG
jgi:hypothetical protein